MASAVTLTSDPRKLHDSALGVSAMEDAAKVKELESQVQLLQAQLQQQPHKNATADEDTAGNDSTQATSHQDGRPGISRFGSFMHSRKTSPLPQNGAVLAPSARERELEAALIKEQTARLAAEQKVKDVNAEIEELSATLFLQANEMVADERKENAILREAIQAIERSQQSHPATLSAVEIENGKLKERLALLEQRELDRKRRLEKLEAANKRIERVRTLLIPR